MKKREKIIKTCKAAKIIPIPIVNIIKQRRIYGIKRYPHQKCTSIKCPKIKNARIDINRFIAEDTILEIGSINFGKYTFVNNPKLLTTEDNAKLEASLK